VSQDNVVPFEHPNRVSLARRGSPDKSRSVSDETVEVECPRCGSVLCLEAALLLLDSEVLCAGCNSSIPIGRPETVDSR